MHHFQHHLIIDITIILIRIITAAVAHNFRWEVGIENVSYVIGKVVFAHIFFVPVANHEAHATFLLNQ